MEDFRNIIVIGASAGGISAVAKVVEGLSNDINAAVLVVLHLSRSSNAGNIVRMFQKHTKLVCMVAEDNTVIRKGHLYLAPADHHLMITGERMRVKQGPVENKYRPSIDVLFRSAAVHFGNRVIGIILTGMLEDGTSGMSAIQRCGGICIVQDPAEAEYADMPRSVLNLLRVDHQAVLAEMPGIIYRLMDQPSPEARPVPRELQIEAELTEKMMSDINQLKKIADRSDFICPDCGGGLWAIKNDPTHRYRCHTGHVYTENMLFDQQGVGLEDSVYVSLRMLEERRNLLLLMRTHALERGDQELAAANEHRAGDINRHIIRLKELLSKLAGDLGPIDVRAN
jgi:two-component system, chemotaxis family, protein-glutamate methylesterase/glutaminase